MEMMLGLFFISTLTLIIASLFRTIYNIKNSVNHFDQNKIGLIQIQNELTLASDFTFEDQFCYVKFNQDYCLSFDRQRLVKTPGYEILLVDINEGYLNLIGDTLLIHFNGDDHEIKLIP